jgi:hypothetical protein
VATKLVAQATYTDAELLALWREAFAAVSVGKSYTLRGKMLTRANIDEITKAITFLEKRIDGASGKSRVVFGRHSR